MNDVCYRKALEGLGKISKERPDFVLVVLPDEAEPIRRAVKFWGDIERGVPTQCVVRGFYRSNLHGDYETNLYLFTESWQDDGRQRSVLQQCRYQVRVFLC